MMVEIIVFLRSQKNNLIGINWVLGSDLGANRLISKVEIAIWVLLYQHRPFFKGHTVFTYSIQGSGH